MENNDRFTMGMCQILQQQCPPSTTEEEAKEALRNHADHTFSSSVTSGNPLPYWGDDGEGYLLQGTSPVGGSGINLGGDVETDPIYNWFIAAETEMTGREYYFVLNAIPRSPIISPF